MKTQTSLHHCWEQSFGFLVMLFSTGIAVWQCGAAECDEWREKMEPIVPQGYLCRRAGTPIVG